jgi:hypothetical protein
MLIPASDSFDFTKIVAVAGFGISIVSLYFTWQSRIIAREQEKRRLPQLVPLLISGYFHNKKNGGGRDYAFLVAVKNPTDSPNAVADIYLSITYITADRLQMTTKIKANEPLAAIFVRGQNEALSVPCSVTAHNTISGWVIFYLPAPMLIGREIESYSLTFTDTHGEASSVVPILIQEYRDDI